MIKIYNIFFTIFFLPVILILSIFSKKIRAGIKEKFGFYNFDFQNEKNILWLHCISVGEVQLIQDIVKKINNYKIVVTTSTPQGQELAKNKLKDYCHKITYFPYDFTFSVKNAIKAINPSAVLIAETEIWPEFSNQIKKKNIPLVIFNGRISDNTFKSYKKLKFIFKKVLDNYSKILTQSNEDREKFIKIGAKEEKVATMGNIKFDIQKPTAEISDLDLNGAPLIIAGSTHKGEDEIIYNAYKKLKEKHKNLKLLIAPRHLERVNSIQNLTNGKLKSKNTFKENDILILDTTGELKNIYSIAHSVFMGGSFNNTGGHNPLEATIWEKPVISGPNIKNFKLVFKNLTEYNCSKIVQNEEELINEFDKLLSNNEHYNNMKKNCFEVFEKNKGALDYLYNFIKKEIS
ncbi:MAG: 3-deoxy-D-manno-octulosonic acid transferase [Cyanobacteria bacterium SIG30]|nr:3-deoxy-D-manno-octulosonic acid transferase [Cyanobacteria bacterium SIG30]